MSAFSPSWNLGVLVGIQLVIVGFAALTGVAVARGGYLLVAPLALIVPAIYLLMRPDVCLASIAGMTLVVAGTLKYFFELGQFQWALSALGAALLAYSLIKTMFTIPGRIAHGSGLELTITLWWAILIFSSLSNSVPLLDWLVGFRIYLPVFGVFAYLSYCKPSEELLRRVIVFMVAIASVQWVFCLYQKFQVIPVRIALQYPGSAWDSVVGTFGGERYGGGESGSLGIYLSIILVMCAALWKSSKMTSRFVLSMIITVAAALAMIESKIVAVMIPLGLFLVYRDYVHKNPARLLFGAVLVFGLMFCLLFVYYYAYWQSDNSHGLIESLFARFAYSFDPDFQASSTNLGRVKSLIFWWDMHSMLDNPLALLIGHGLASAVSASAIIGEGTQVQRYGVMLDVTGASKLLWETGLFGLFLFILLFAIGFNRAQRLKRHPDVPDWHRAAMSGVEAAMVLMPISIFYEVTVVSSPPMQFTAMFLLGYVAYWWRETRGARCG